MPDYPKMEKELRELAIEAGGALKRIALALNEEDSKKPVLTGHTYSNTTFEIQGKALSASGKAWMNFSSEVLHHLENYSVPQYGDLGSDEITKYDIPTCVIQMQRYLARVGQNARPEEEDRGFLKVAVYAMRAWDKLKNGGVTFKPKLQLTDNELLMIHEKLHSYLFSKSQEHKDRVAHKILKKISAYLASI